MTSLRGYDLSSLQGVLSPDSWRAVAHDPDVRFVSLRCGYGNNPHDPAFAANVAGARAVGLVVQAYHVGFPLRPDPAHPGREPEAQARAHFAAAGGLGRGRGELPPALDLEWPPPQEWTTRGIDAAFVVHWAEAYGATMAALVGRTPLLYTYPVFHHALARGADLARLAGLFDLWAAEYQLASPVVLPPWKRCLFWQRSGGGGRLPWGAPVDEDVFVGSEEEFLRMANFSVDVDVTDGGANNPVPPPIDPSA
jgi:lysozyme